MTRAALLAFRPVTKEIRALAPAFLACLATMVAAIVFRRWRVFVVPTYFLGASALGALAIGHEYSYGTLPLLLSQPARRERHLLVKLGVLAAMLATIGAVAGAVVTDDRLFPEPYRLAIVVLPVLCGLCLAPWITMVCRSPIAGAVFTLSPPGMILTVSRLLYLAAYGRGLTVALERAIVWRGTLGLCAVGAVMTWRLFMRLEAIDGRGADLDLPQWLRWRTTGSAAASALTTHHPVWLLVKKELRLRQMVLAIAGLYVLEWLTAVSLNPFVPKSLDVFYILSIFYAGLIALLSGSLASAEERQLGTLEWELLLPIAASKQWAVKVGVALGLTLLLALGLPALLASISPTTHGIAPGAGAFLRPEAAIWAILLTSCGLYVSSLASSGLWALLLSLPAILGATLFVNFLIESVEPRIFGVLPRVFNWVVPLVPVSLVESRFMSVLALLLPAGVLFMLLRFALANHRSADRTADRVLKQLIWMAGGLTIGVTLLAGVAAFS